MWFRKSEKETSIQLLQELGKYLLENKADETKNRIYDLTKTQTELIEKIKVSINNNDFDENIRIELEKSNKEIQDKIEQFKKEVDEVISSIEKSYTKEELIQGVNKLRSLEEDVQENLIPLTNHLTNLTNHLIEREKTVAKLTAIKTNVTINSIKKIGFYAKTIGRATLSGGRRS